MDRVIEKKKWSAKRISIIAGITVLVLVLGFLIFDGVNSKSKLDVDKERITISEITKGPFQENIPVNGIVEPITTIYLDAVEGGRVEKKFVEDGTEMKAGQPIMKLSDLDLELQLAQQQAQVFNTITQMQINSGQATTATVGKLQNMEDADNSYRDALRVYELDKKLYAQKAIGSQEYQIAVNTYNYALNKKKLNEKILKQDSIIIKQQNKQSQEEYDNMKRNLELMKEKVGDLIVKAPIDGQLTSMDVEVGENISKGQRLGEIDVLSGFKLKVTVDEHYITRVFKGLTGDFPLGDKTYKVKVTKVYDQVKAGTGQFQVDMEFVGQKPDGLRVGQTLQVRLALSDQIQAVLLPKGGFYQTTGGNWIFKVSADGKTATKVNIQLNLSNPDYYQVTDGLYPGDKVITSSYDTFGDAQVLVLK